MIAISYRREDSLPITGRLYDRLQARFGKEKVFMDFDSIPPGVDFREHIKRTIERSKIVIAVIGPRWLGDQGNATRRIDDPEDFVRLEIEYALRQGVPVIPLLVDNTVMPKPGKLPPDMEPLAFRNALPLDSGRDFHNHADRLITGICGLVDVNERPKADTTDAPAKSSATKKSNKRIALLGAVGALIGIVAIATWYSGFFQNFGKTRSIVIPANGSRPSPKTSAPTETSAPVVKAGPVYKGTIHPQTEQNSLGTPLTINFADDRKSGTMTQTTKSGDTVVKFDGVWDTTTLHAVTGEVMTQPKNIQWKPESFTLRFAEDWKRGSYECNSEGILYTAELAPP
ncbi:MAG: hypothetical protein QOD80_187 [Verrucomicrobiota bacterium]|jgi:hypothetical protein